MITKTLRTQTGKIKVSIPENIRELTISQLIAMQEAKFDELKSITPDMKILSILSGVSEEILANVIDFRDISAFTDRVLSLAHQIKYCYDEASVPDHIIFGTKRVKILGLFYVERDNRVKVIKNLSMEPAGAFLASKDLIADEINKHIELYGEEEWKDNFVPDLNCVVLILAHYFYCRVTGNPYIEQKAEEFKSEILKLPVQLALPIGRYFFLAYPNLLQQKVSLWEAIRQTWRKKRVLRRLKSLNTSTQ